MASLVPHCGRSAQRITAIFPVLSTTVVTERRTVSRSHVGFTMCSLEGAVCSGGSICKWPSCRHSLYSTAICAMCVGPIFVKISGILGGHRRSVISQIRSEFVGTNFGKRGSNFSNSTPSKNFQGVMGGPGAGHQIRT